MGDEKTTVLLIEDNPGDARLIQEYISESGSDVFRLEHVERLSYGLKFLDECNIGIILLDLTLPDSQGLEGLLKILAKAPDVPVVVLSGIKDEMVAIEAVHAGAQDYLVKGSIDANLLVRLLRHAIERHHLRVALQNSESRYRLLADNIADVVWVANEKGWITYVSPSIERMLGFTAEEVEKLRIRDILTPDSAEQARRLIKNQMELGVQQSRSSPLSLTLEHVRKDGSTVWAEVMLSFLLDKKGNLAGIMGSTRDVTARKRAEEALQRSEEHFRSLTENASDAILIINGDGVLKYESPSIQRLLGYRFEERVGKSVFENIHPDDRKNVIDAFVQLVQEVGKITQMEMRVRHKNGSWRIIDVTAKNLLDNPAVAGIVANFHDITERKEAEKALRVSEEKLRRYWDSSPDAVYVHDLKGTFLAGNKAAERMTGYSREEIEGKSFLEFNLLPAEYLEKASRLLQLSAAGLPTGPDEFEMIRKDGSRVFVEVSAYPMIQGGRTEVIGIARDINERKRMEEALQESETRFRTVFEGTSMAIALVDRRGKPLGVNPAFSRMFGYSFEEFCSLNKLKYLYPDDAMVDAGLYMEMLNGNRDHYTIDKRYICKDGGILWGRQNLSVVRNAEGKPEYFIAMIEDITERKKMEEEIIRLSDAVKMSTDSIVLTDLEGVLVEANEAALKIQGAKSRGELIGLKPFDAIVPEDQEKAFADLAAIMEKGHVNEVHYHIMTRDGRRILLETSASLMRDGNGVPTGIVAVSRDITERKRMEEALRESEERLRLYFESVSDVIYSLDKDFRFESISPSVERILGYKPEEVLGNRFDEINLLVPETVKQAFVDVTRVLGGDRIVTGGKFVRKDGGIIYGEVSLTPIFAPDGSIKGALGVARDITERKKAEKALRDSEEKHRLYFESVSDVIYSIDREMRVTSVSPSVEKVLGYKPEELIGKIFPEINILTPESMECAVPTAMGVLNGERAISEWVFIAKDGVRKYGEVISTPLFGPDGKVTGALGVGRDITERKRMEEALRLSERDYKVLFESTLDGLIVLDAETMKIVLANQTAAKLAGVSSSDALIVLDPFEFIPIENRDATRNLVREDVFEKDLHKIHEHRVCISDGRGVWVSAVSTRTEYRGKKAALISVRDITERKKAEEEKQKMEEQLRLAGRLAAVGELASGVAHELNNPITAVQGYAQLLAAKKDIGESVKKDLNTIYREAQRAGKITRNLLSFARRHEPEKRFISINEALEKTLELSAHQMKIHDIELEVELDRNLPGTMADFHQMQQIFVNIINNAEQAMLDAHGKGKLVVRTGRYGDMIQIVFTDDGPGIAEENLKRIFDPFFTTKGVGKGTGLGLSICYGLVEAHNGRIYARSKPGEGATFVVEIPVVPEEVPAAEAVFIKTKKGSARWRK